MCKDQITQIIADQTDHDGLTETGIHGVRLFRATQAIPCVPAVYEPCIVAIVSGTKEVVFDGQHHVYDHNRYLCCPMSMPVKAGTPTASPENPLYGVFINFDPRVMSQLVVDIDNNAGLPCGNEKAAHKQGIRLASWDEDFTEAMLRLLLLINDAADTAILGHSRLRELYYAILKGEAGLFTRRAFGAGNAIARSIAHVSSCLDTPVSIDEMASRAGMSRAAFHRKFKKVTTMSPIQFVKSMRLNSAAMKIVGGMAVSEAALGVGYVSPSQFSRDFKRVYGMSPRQWADTHRLPTGLA